MEDQSIEVKREVIINFFKNKKQFIYFILLLLVLWYGASFRLGNLPLLIDKTTSDYITADPDAALYLRYSKEIVTNGDLSEIDYMRNYPLGLETIRTNPIIAHTIAILYKVINIFNKDITVAKVDVIYPVIFFVFGMIIFYFLIAKLLNREVALLSTFVLSVLPAYLFRTLAGVGDKEPYGMFFLFLSLLLYLISRNTNKFKFAILFAILSGIATGMLNLGWNGANFVFLLISLDAIINIFLDRFDKKDIYIYTSWFILVNFIIIFFRAGFKELQSLLFSVTSSSVYFVFLVGIVLILFHLKKFENIKQKIEKKIPIGIASLIISFIIITIITSIFISPTFIFDKFKSIIDSLIHPFGLGRLTLTVAESYQPYFTDWIGTFTWPLLILFFIGTTYLFYQIIKPLKNLKWKLIILYILFLPMFVMSRYSRDSTIFNGETTTSNIFYIGSLLVFVATFAIIYFYSYYKKQEQFEQLRLLDKNYLFLFIWMILMIIAARGAIRLFFVLAPIIAIFSSYIIVEAVYKTLKLKERIFKYSLIFVIIFLLFSPLPFYNGMLVKFAKASSNSAKFTGPAYDQQWQEAMAWVRDHTKKDAVFAHWWDYGYWVQTGGERPTILDGGNFNGYWDYLMGRHVLTAQNETEALEFLKAHNSSYLLIDPTDIGKYTAYSSIGSDLSFDRLSYISNFQLNPQLIQETRNDLVYIYEGSFALDEDFIYDGKLFPRSTSGIIGFKIPVSRTSTENEIIINQPVALLAHNNQLTEVNVECLQVLGQQRIYQNAPLKGCILLVPTFDNNQILNKNVNFLGGLMYISERSRRALWVNLYLFEIDSPYFKEVYRNPNVPIALVNGQNIGPIKIWEISYPNNIKIKPQYLLPGYPEDFNYNY